MTAPATTDGATLPPLVIATIGGSGSHRLMASLATTYRVANKPDNTLRMNYHRLWAGRFGLDEGTFTDRSLGYEWPAGPWLEDGFADYMAWVDRQQSYALVSGTFSELGLFSAHQIPGVIFLFRSPVQALLSWAKPYRHGDVVDYLGGIDSPASLDFFAARWNAHAREAVRLQRLGILGGAIRFEQAPTDAARLGLGWAFADFVADRSTPEAALAAGSIDHLTRATAHMAEEVAAL